MIRKIQTLKGKTNPKIHKNISDQYDQINNMRQSSTFQFEEDPSSKRAQDVAFKMHEALLLMKTLQTKPQVKSMKKNHYDLYYTVIENLSDEGEN